MVEGLEELVDEMLDGIDEYDDTEEFLTSYKDNEDLRELGILIDEYEE